MKVFVILWLFNYLNSLPRIDIIVYPRSDRDICEVEFTMDNFRNGPSYWKLNSEHLKDKNFVNEVSEMLDVICKDYIGVLNDQELWDLCKVKIKQVAIAYSKKKAKEGLDKLYIFETKVNELHKHLAKYPEDQSSLEKYNYYKAYRPNAHLSYIVMHYNDSIT